VVSTCAPRCADAAQAACGGWCCSAVGCVRGVCATRQDCACAARSNARVQGDQPRVCGALKCACAALQDREGNRVTDAEAVRSALQVHVLDALQAAVGRCAEWQQDAAQWLCVFAATPTVAGTYSLALSATPGAPAGLQLVPDRAAVTVSPAAAAPQPSGATLSLQPSTGLLEAGAPLYRCSAPATRSHVPSHACMRVGSYAATCAQRTNMCTHRQRVRCGLPTCAMWLARGGSACGRGGSGRIWQHVGLWRPRL
jgi:hypothetical protein